MNLIEVGRRITLLRELAGFESQRQFAAALGISFHVVGTWERGRSYPMHADFEKLCDVLDCSLDYLFLGKIDGLPKATLQKLVDHLRPKTVTRKRTPSWQLRENDGLDGHG